MRFLLTSLLLICIPPLSLSQDIHFSQFFEAPLLRNPSLAGIYRGDIRVQGVYRDQWNSFTNAYRTGSINAEYKMPVGKGNDFMTHRCPGIVRQIGHGGTDICASFACIELSQISQRYQTHVFIARLYGRDGKKKY